MNGVKYNRELCWVELSKCFPDEKHVIYGPKARPDINISVSEKGILQPLTGYEEGDRILIFDGRERLEVAKSTFPTTHKVPIWIIKDKLSDDEIHWIMLDLERTRKKNYVDILAEFYLYNSLIPSNQGKKDVENSRIQIICDLIGVSKSQLMMLQRIDKINPSLIHAVDSGVITLDSAKRKAREIEKHKDSVHEKCSDETVDEGNDIGLGDKEVNLIALPKQCPSCNRPFSSIRFEDIPELFSLNRKETDLERDWIS